MCNWATETAGHAEEPWNYWAREQRYKFPAMPGLEWLVHGPLPGGAAVSPQVVISLISRQHGHDKQLPLALLLLH